MPPQCESCGKFYKLKDDRGMHFKADFMGPADDTWICKQCFEKQHTISYDEMTKISPLVGIDE